MVEKVRDGWNDLGLCGEEVRRGYVYSKGDRLVGWRDVERHVAEARGRGCWVVKEEFGEGSGHVVHAREDPVRYWAFVMKVWEGSREGKEVEKRAD